MAITLTAPKNSFVQFTETDLVESCEYPPIELCLPVYEDDDVNFQFIIQADSKAEADALCGITNTAIQIGLVEDCQDAFIITFAQATERYRISDTKILYNWAHGLPGFSTVISRGQCFFIKIVVSNLYTFCSTCFQRIADTCHTSVLEYHNDDNFAGFNYCNSVDDELIPGGAGSECFDSTIIQFNNRPSLVVPYTAALQAKYGDVPTVKVWIYDENSELVDMGVRVAFDNFPVNVMSFDFGGPASGIVVIK